MKNLHLVLATGFLAIITISCSKDNTETPANELVKDLSGEVHLYNDGTSSVSDNGMIVRIEDSNPAIGVSTDERGKFRMAALAEGTYTLIFEKDGYGTFKIFDVDHTKEEATFLSANPSLGQLSTTSVSLIVPSINNGKLTLETTLNQEASISDPRYLRVFFSTTDDLSPDKYDHFTSLYLAQNNPVNIVFTKDDLISFGFRTGQRVYVNVAGDSYFSNTYEDPNLNRRIFPNLFWTKSEYSFVVP